MLAKSGTRALGAVISKYKHLSNMGYNTFTKCFESYVCPVLDYSSEVWGSVMGQKIDAVQNKAMRVFLGVHKFAANQMLDGDMGWYPSKLRRKISMLRLWNRLLKMNNIRLPKLIFEREFQLNGKWCQTIRNILKEINMEEFYDGKQICNLDICKTKLKEKHHEAWRKLANKKSKLKIYTQIKVNFGVEKHILLNLTRNERSILSQLRCSILPLQIEIGRFTNQKKEERLCPICNSGNIETECHFLFDCSYYEEERNSFFNSIDVKINDMESQILFLNELFKIHPRKLAKYCSKIMQSRKGAVFKTNPLS